MANPEDGQQDEGAGNGATPTGMAGDREPPEAPPLAGCRLLRLHRCDLLRPGRRASPGMPRGFAARHRPVPLAGCRLLRLHRC